MDSGFAIALLTLFVGINSFFFFCWFFGTARKDDRSLTELKQAMTWANVGFSLLLAAAAVSKLIG